MSKLHIFDLIIIGAGPIGLEAALYAEQTGLDFLLLEAETPCAALAKFQFVKLFSPTAMNTSSLGRRLVKIKDSNGCVTAGELKRHYFDRIAERERISSQTVTGFSVSRIGRRGLLKSDLIGEQSRSEYPFVIYGKASDGEERTYSSRSVIDASGVYSNPNGLGTSGLPPLGEGACRDRISYHLVELTDRNIREYGRKFLVAGAGHSACTMVNQLTELSKAHDLEITWVAPRRDSFPIPVIADDPLPERRRVSEQANRAIAEKLVNVRGGWWIETLEPEKDAVGVTLSYQTDNEYVLTVDHIFAMVGYQPDRTLYQELQVHECYATAGPMKLAAALIGAGASDCLADIGGGDDLYDSSEPNFYIIGAKSYGRSTNFLLQKGHDQIRSVFRQLTGDPELDLYRSTCQNT